MNNMNNIKVISYPISSSFKIPLSNLLTILSNIGEHNVSVCIATNETEKIFFNLKIPIFNVPYAIKGSFLLRVINYIKIEILIARHIYREKDRTEKIIFFMEGNAILPSIVARFFRIPIMRLLPSGIIACNIKRNPHQNLDYVIYILQIVGYLAANVIGIYGEDLIDEWRLHHLNGNKIRIISEHLVDFDLFNIMKPYAERKRTIAYIGRLSPEKGITSFVESIPKILDENSSIKVFIIGSGCLQKEIQKDLERMGAGSRIELIPWVDHQELPKILNELKLLIIPSCTEGIPNIMLEAMACGTPVLSNSVGAIPDIITDGVNGFLMENNDPEIITNSVLRCLQNEDMEKISISAATTVRNSYELDIASVKWIKILESL